jgi:hypothetical protein
MPLAGGSGPMRLARASLGDAELAFSAACRSSLSMMGGRISALPSLGYQARLLVGGLEREGADGKRWAGGMGAR